jgi:hypothetical protein
MPNQRSRNKTYLGGFVEKKLHERIVRLARKAGMGDNKFGFVTQLVQEALKKRKTPRSQKAAGRKATRAKA